MTPLSDKELLEKMKEFPVYGLNEKQKNSIMMKIREQTPPRRKSSFPFQQMGVLGALFAILIIAPVLFLINSELPETNSSVEKAKSGEYFALVNEAGEPIYVDSNYGIPGKVSLLLPGELVAEDYRGVAKIMVYLWGNSDELINKDMKIEGVHVDSGYTQEMASFTVSNGMNGSDAHALTSFKPFEKQGYWNMKFIYEDKTFGEFSVYVKEPYVEIDQATLMISKEDLTARTFKDVGLEIEGENLPEQVKLGLFSLEDGSEEVFIFSDRTDYIKASTAKKISVFTGDITLKKSGKYRITVLDQSVQIDVKE